MARKRSSSRDDRWWAREPNRPIQPSEGIRAKSRSGKFVANWWATRWIAALKEWMDSGRLSRGRSYARRGQVLEIEIEPGHIAARVQGSRLSPYQVDIHLNPLTDGQWADVVDALSQQALFAAQLLNGEMPQQIEHVFEQARVPLFPESENDLQTSCSCPDWANPCKHIAAVYYLVGEQFDNDPFLLFQLRGRDKEQVIAALQERRVQHHPPGLHDEAIPYQANAVQESDPLSNHIKDYWSGGIEIPLDLCPSPVQLAVFQRAGPPDPLRDRGRLERLQQAYSDVAAWALDLAFADRDSDLSPEDTETTQNPPLDNDVAD